MNIIRTFSFIIGGFAISILIFLATPLYAGNGVYKYGNTAFDYCNGKHNTASPASKRKYNGTAGVNRKCCYRRLNKTARASCRFGGEVAGAACETIYYAWQKKNKQCSKANYGL